MGIKTYGIIEAAGLLKEKGVNAILNGTTTLYVPSKALLHKRDGVFELNVEENGEVRMILSTADEDVACREVLKMFGVKTIKTKVKKKEAPNGDR